MAVGQSRTGPRPEPTEGPGVDRAIMLTDAVTAIAMTLLVLPLVEMSGEVEADHLGAFFADHWDLVLSFTISFLVVYVFWAAHGSAYRRVVEAGADLVALRPLTMLWLLVIAFLPFPTAVVGRDLTTTSATFYIGTMLVLSVLTSAITTVVDHRLGTHWRTGWAWATTAVFAVCTLAATVSADLGLFGLLALAVLRVVEVRIAPRWSPDPSAEPPAEAADGAPLVHPSPPDNEGAADEHLRAVTADTGPSDPSRSTARG